MTMVKAVLIVIGAMIAFIALISLMVWLYTNDE